MANQKLKAWNPYNLPVIVIVFGLMLGSCGEQQNENADEQAAIHADFIELKTSSTHIVETYPGNIEGTVNVDIRAQVSGYLEAIYVNEGDYVQKGQSLFKIKSEVYNEQVMSSNAVLESALAAQTNAQIEVEKIKPLVAGKVVTELQLKTAQAQYKAAQAQVAQAKSALSSAQLNAAFAVIKAPVSGYIGRIPSRVGNLVTATDSKPLTSLSEIEKVYVYFNLNEAKFMAYIHATKNDSLFNSVEIIMADGNTYDKKGIIEIASGNIDRQTGTIALKAVFENPDKQLRAGGSARVVLTKNMDNAISLPMAAVKDIQDRYFIYMLDKNNKVAMKPIEIAGRSGSNYIIKSGVNVGDKIAINAIDQLAEGLAVTATVVALDSLKINN